MGNLLGYGTRAFESWRVISPALKDQILSACTTNDVSALKDLLEKQDRSILETAAKNGGVDVVRYLLDRKSTMDGSEQLVLEQAARTGNAAVFRYIVERNPQLLEASRTVGLDAINGGIEIWKIINEHNRHVMNRSWGHHGDVVHHVVKNNNVPLLAYLLDEGAEVEREDSPILQYTKHAGSSQEIVDLLVKHGANVNWEES
ncbi:MAG: hypothetical protein M1827_000435 [Pycnora praestabilis]|nr:MAG: hypothetical protein M1827_000435 [Pycnora praestabilis]